jgi:hypothetical protein
MIRLIQFKILNCLGKDTQSGEKWESGLSAKRTRKALNEWAAHVTNGCYHFRKASEVLRLIKAAFGVDYGYEFPTTNLVREIKRASDRTVLKTRDGAADEK